MTEGTPDERIFGKWFTAAAKNSEFTRETFAAAQPYPHMILDDFLEDELAAECAKDFPALNDPIWHIYNNPIEKKWVCNRIGDLKSRALSRVFETLQSAAWCRFLSELTNIEALESDPLLHGGGLHLHPKGTKLDMHLDYSLHPILHKERRLNLILYLVDPEWRDEYDGALQLWDERMERCVTRVIPKFNRAVIFRVSDISYHGVPDEIACPEHMSRKSLATYYLTKPREGIIMRPKALFVKRPQDPDDPEMQRLRDIRARRRIEDADLTVAVGVVPPPNQ